MTIDLNADLGEGMTTDEELMPIISSANICCAAHAGTHADMARAIDLAKSHGTTIGAHPGYADCDHFGRREIGLSPQCIFELCQDQINALVTLAKERDARVKFVKPHGALYHRACRDRAIAEVIAIAAATFELAIVGLPHSQLEASAHKAGLHFIAEGFADRRYRDDGTLVPREEHDAVIEDIEIAASQVEELVRKHGVKTICVHGDHPKAVPFARALKAHLVRCGFTIGPAA